MKTIIEEANDIILTITKRYGHDIDLAEMLETLEKIQRITDDGILYIDGAEYRIIHTNSIERIFEDAVAEMLEETVEGLKDLPPYICIDWAETVHYMSCDGYSYGDQFNTVDGKELFAGGYYIFKTE